MTELLTQAIQKVSQLSTEQQNVIATIILEELEDEQRWAEAFAHSEDKLARLADTLRAKIEAGRFKPMGFDEL